jgi:hypothetical protein
MIDYLKWPRKKFSVVNLKLDDQNPRLPGVTPTQTQTQPKIIDYLVEHEGVFELAKAIATKGYLLNEEPIVCKENNKFVVLEGNRRVAACKLLVNPDLIKSKTKRKVLDNLLRTFDISIVTKLEVRIAPDRDSADVIIVNRHTDGGTVEPWDKTKQDRFFHNRVLGGESIDALSSKFNIRRSLIKETLVRYNMYNELLQVDFDVSQRKDVEDETKFAMTNVERFYNSKLGKEFLGLSFNDKGLPLHSLPKEEYNKRLKRIALDVVSKKLNSRTYGDEKDQSGYIDILKKSNEFDLHVLPSNENQISYTSISNESSTEEISEQPSEVRPRNIVRETPGNKMIASDCHFKTKNNRIDAIFKELKSANLDTQFNSSAVLFRSYIDMIVYQFLLKNDAVKDIIIEEHQKLTSEFNKKTKRISDYIVSISISEPLIIENDFIKALGGKPGIKKGWIPTLRQMLVYIAKSDVLLPDARLRQALSSYVKGNDSYLDHNDFNLLVHNEYYLTGARDLKEAWNKLFPLITHINQQLSIQP